MVKDQHGRILDGNHRDRLARELGVVYDTIRVEVETEEEAQEISRTLNADRRHLSPEQLRTHVKFLREAGHSQGATAQALGVSQPYVSKIEKQLITSNELARPERTIGLDGKSRPATPGTPHRCLDMLHLA